MNPLFAESGVKVPSALNWLKRKILLTVMILPAGVTAMASTRPERSSPKAARSCPVEETLRTPLPPTRNDPSLSSTSGSGWLGKYGGSLKKLVMTNRALPPVPKVGSSVPSVLRADEGDGVGGKSAGRSGRQAAPTGDDDLAVALDHQTGGAVYVVGINGGNAADAEGLIEIRRLCGECQGGDWRIGEDGGFTCHGGS